MHKTKQARRTKNNARPSNSSRSAELLGSSIPNFVGFSAVKDGGYVPVLPGLTFYNTKEVEMNSVDSNFQVVLKKMNKKDGTTKCKALQEFAIMCRDSDLSAVEGMLPFWPRLYSVLAIDVEHRVREATQLAHGAVVKRVGKGIAIYLKQLAGTWFTSKFDTYPPAASAATNAFSDTFAENKVIDAIVHCQREILTYICDNITVHTPQSLSIQKNLATEEMETKYQRVLIASLQGYSVYLKKIPLREIEKMTDIHRKIISSNQFWKLVKHDALPVKTAFFNVLTSMIQNATMLLHDEKKRTVTSIMNSLDESEPALLSAVWEAMLVTINKIEDWHTTVNIEKLVLPKLWRVLRSGGQCCASIVYPNLLPFISQFPKLNVDPHNLYINFFNNMRQGFSVKSLQMSRSGMSAVTTSFVECFRYSVLLNLDNRELRNALIKEQLIPVLEMCFKENSPMKGILFNEISQLVRYWSKNRYNNNCHIFYSSLMQEFWGSLDALFTSLIESSKDSETFDTFDTDNSEIEFLIALKTIPNKNRKNLKVKFNNLEEDIITQSQVQLTTTNDIDELFMDELYKFVDLLCLKYFDQIIDQRVKKYVVHLNKLITCFENKQSSEILSRFLKRQINFLNVYNEILLVWLLEQSKESEHIIEFLFNIIKYIGDFEKDQVLETLTEFNDIVITRSVIQCALSKKYRNDVVLKKLCSQSKITNLLINVVKEIVSGNCSDLEKNKNLILLAFEPLDNAKLLIREEGFNEIISIICNSFHKIDESCLLDFARLISSILPLMWTHKQATAVQALETFFHLRSQNCFTNNSSFHDIMRDVWKSGVSEATRKLSQTEFVQLTKKFATSLWEKIYNRNEENSKEMLVDIAADFLEIILDNQIDYAEEIIVTFLIDSNVVTWMAEMTEIVIYGEVLTGKLYVSSLEQKLQIHDNSISINLNNDSTKDNIENCLTWAYFNINLLNKLCSRSINGDSSAQNLTIHNLNISGVTDLLIDIVYSITLGYIYSNHYRSTKCYNNAYKILMTAKESFKCLQEYINENTFHEILDYIKLNHWKYGCMLPYIIYFCCTELYPCKEPKKLFEDCKINNVLVTNEETMLQSLNILAEIQNLEEISAPVDNKLHELIVARSVLHGREIDSAKLFNILEKITSYDKDSLLKFDCEISEISWDKWNLTLQFIRLLTDFIKRAPSELIYEYWDLLIPDVLISLVSYHNKISESKENANNFKLSTLTVAACQLYYALQNLINSSKQENLTATELCGIGSWKNVFEVLIQSDIIQFWMFYSDSCNGKTIGLKPIVLLDHLGIAVKMLDGNVIFGEKSNVSLETSVELALKFLQFPIASIQLSAYHVLKHAVQKLVQQDIAIVEVENFDSNTLNIRKMEEVLQNTQNIVNTMLMDFKQCDTVSCTIQPYTDAYTYTVGYLLSWAIILNMCAHAHGDLLYQYAEILKDNFFPSLLNNIFRLMPVEVLQDSKNKGAKLVEIFSTEPYLDFGESWTEWRLDHIVCWLYTNSLRYLPVLVRQWWSTADGRVSAAVDKITTHYVSPMLCQEELQNNKLRNIENMQVKVHPTSREVVALYQMDDTKLELNIVLPSNHPLGVVTVEPGQHAGGTANWRNCHMQLSMFLIHQNGSVWDGLALWKRNLDKKFAGVEECYICFSIFHINTYKIPKLSCSTCHKKFHTACLYKWFSTSQKSTCPICRNTF